MQRLCRRPLRHNQRALADLATTAAKQAQLGLVPLPPVRLASLGAAESKGDPEQAFSKVTAMKEISSDENAPGMQTSTPPAVSAPPRHAHARPQSQSSNTLNERAGSKRAEPQTATRPRAQKPGRPHRANNFGQSMKSAFRPNSAILD